MTMFKPIKPEEPIECEGCRRKSLNVNPCGSCGFENLGFINSPTKTSTEKSQ